jgi:hypothetical protein
MPDAERLRNAPRLGVAAALPMRRVAVEKLRHLAKATVIH